MGAAEAGRARARRGVALGRPARRAAHLFAASGFAFAQPLLDILGRNAEFFAVRGSPPLDIVLFALAVVFLPPAILLAIELAGGAVSARAGVALHLAFLGMLGGAFAIQALDRLGVDRTRYLLAGALLAAVGLAAAVARVPLVRSFLTILAAGPLVFLGFFLFGSQASKLVFPADVDVELAAVGSTTPVVMVLFDELPTVSLLDERGSVDEGRFPNFARLARSSTWFVNATTLSPSTTIAVPSLLSGRDPQRGMLPIYQNHPENLFTLLGGSYRLNVIESQTRLCPRDLCGFQGDEAGRRLRSLFSDARVVYLHLVAPPALEARLPAVDEAWAGFGDAPDDELEDRGGLPRIDIRTFYLGREDEFARFLDSLGRGPENRPTLDFLHVLLPHGPWLRFPDGRESAVESARAPGRSGETWVDEGLAHQAYQRHLLQLGYTDALLGALEERLRELELWDRALLVVTADHGISFRGGDRRRAPTEQNLAEVAFVPLFLKLPGQATGRAVEKHVTIIDVLPTIADALGIEIPWETDGESGLAPGPGRENVRVNRTSEPLAAAVARREAALARQVELFGTGSFGPRFFGVGPYGELVGQPLDAHDTAAEADGEAVVDGPGARLLRSFDERSVLVPSPLTGTLSGEAAAGDWLAVAVNGRLAAVCQAYAQAGSPLRFSALAAQAAFRPGENEVRVFLVDGGREAPALRELPVRLSDG